jgi:Tol biopolymer transport system component
LAEYARLSYTQLSPVLETLSSGDVRILRPITPPPDQPAAPRYEIFHVVLGLAILDWRARYVQKQERADTVRQLASERQRVTRWRLGAVGLCLLLVVMVALAIFAFQQQKRAAQQARLSFSRELAAAAISNLDTDPERSVLLTLHATSESYSKNEPVIPEVEDALNRAVQASRVRLTLSGHTQIVRGVSFSPDGRQLATASLDGTAKIWDATASWDGTAKLWDASSGRELRTLHGHAAAVSSVTFSPDGKQLATASWDGTAKLWDASSGQELRTLRGHTDAVNSVAYSRDGKQLATASDDRTAKLWDASSGEELRTLRGHSNTVYSVTFSPDGRQLATASIDRTAKLWDASSGQGLFTLVGHTNILSSIIFSSDGTRLATASWDKTARVWDASSGRELSTLSHTREVMSVTFSPDGTRLTTASADRIVRVYVLNIEALIALAQTRVTRLWTPEECKKYLHLEQCPPTP